MNIVIIDGFLGQDPKITETEKGPCATLQIANHDRKAATWVPLVAFGNKVALMGKTIRKGDKIILQGRIRMREVESRYLEVEVTYFQKVEKLEWNDTPATAMSAAFDKAKKEAYSAEKLETAIKESEKAQADGVAELVDGNDEEQQTAEDAEAIRKANKEAAKAKKR